MNIATQNKKLKARILCLEEEMNRLAKAGVSLDDPEYQQVQREWEQLNGTNKQR